MVLLTALYTAFTTLMVAYISLTGTLAMHIEELLIPTPRDTEEHALSTQVSPSPELTSLSKLYAGAEGISRVLRDSALFQNAANTIDGIGTHTLTTTQNLTETLRGSLVNIYCTYETGEYLRTTTGTGFFIDEDGVILTNAHVAQFLLLENVSDTIKNAECVIRSGTPATPQYRAELLFISPSWILTNAALVNAKEPRGTGEYDYALLYVSESLTENPLPETYTALPFSTNLLPKGVRGNSVITGGYPAEQLSRERLDTALEAKIADASIRELYTFGSNYADIFTITESAVGEQGASGGPVAHESYGAIGLIVTKGDTRTEGEQSLRALTLSYVDRTILEETGFSLLENTQGDLPVRSRIFKEVLAPYLTQLLLFEIDSDSEREDTL